MAGNAEWLDKEHNKVLLLWKKPEDWANVFIKWVRSYAGLLREG